MKSEPNFFGKDGFYWFMGVVEDRGDPKMLGRLRVRILGAHTDNKQFIPTCELQWAYVYQPIFSAAMNGIGMSPVGPVEGTWIFGFFKDGPNCQDPVILGTLGGIPEEAPQPSLGFYDPGTPFHNPSTSPRKIVSRYYPNDGTGAQNQNESTASLYPRSSNPWSNILGEPDTNRLATATNIDDTIIGVRSRQRDVKVPIAFCNPTPVNQWSEPESGYNTKYPYNHVFESESGHIIEIDDTPNAERIHIWHRSGTYIEIGNDAGDNPGLTGDMTVRCVGKKYEITMKNSYSHYQNTMNVTVDGQCNILCRSDANIEVDGNLTVEVQGNYVEKVHGNYTTDIDGNHTIKIGGTESRNSGGAMSDLAGGSIKQSASGSFQMASGGTLSGDAPAVHWNSGMGSVSSPASPDVPSLPSPLNKWTEDANDSGSDPTAETKTNPSNPTFSQSDC